MRDDEVVSSYRGWTGGVRKAEHFPFKSHKISPSDARAFRVVDMKEDGMIRCDEG